MRVRGPLLTLLAALQAVAAGWPAAALPQVASGPYQTTRPYERMPDRGREKLTAEQKKAETYVAKLLGRAQSAVAIHQYAGATAAYEDALTVLETVYEPDDVRLVEVLSGIVYARMTWDSYGSHYGFGARKGLKVAVKAQERIVAIYDGRDDVNPNDRIAAQIDLGDVYLYMDDPRALDTYRDAWRRQAEIASAEEADALFASIGIVRLVLPENPMGHEEWLVTVTYDVGPDGVAIVSGVAGNAPQWLEDDVRTKYADGRFRPRLIGGEPVSTRGISFSHKYIATNQQEDSSGA